jgi:hypothetical protein
MAQRARRAHLRDNELADLLPLTLWRAAIRSTTIVEKIEQEAALSEDHQYAAAILAEINLRKTKLLHHHPRYAPAAGHSGESGIEALRIFC